MDDDLDPMTRKSLDPQLPQAPRSDEPFEG